MQAKYGLKARFRRYGFIFLGFCVLAFMIVWFGNAVFILFESDKPSCSHGTPGKGKLENGKRLPTSGANYRAYSRLGALLGRNSVHGTVRTVVLEAYASLEKTVPDLTFVYGEASWPNGGPLPPHRTHMNGLSVDFMAPLRDNQGNSARLPTFPWNYYGYLIDFDRQGRLGNMQIDFEAMAKHLAALQRSARAHGIRINRVILTPEYQPLLWQTPTGKLLKKKNISFSRKPAWVRHDEHYHVDFSNPAG